MFFRRKRTCSDGHDFIAICSELFMSGNWLLISSCYCMLTSAFELNWLIGGCPFEYKEPCLLFCPRMFASDWLLRFNGTEALA